jgi:hypothetical protein
MIQSQIIFSFITMKPIVLFVFILSAISAQANEVRDTTIKGVHVSFDYSRKIFPEFWQQPPINAEAEPIQVSEIERCKKILANALSKYPFDMLARELKSVYFMRAMKFYDVGYGGTNSTDALYLTNNGHSMGYTNLYVEQTFHHEFSSILYRNHTSLFSEREWSRANAPSFSYTDPENGVGAIRDNRSSQEFDTVLCEKGFLTQYSTSGIENDLNTFAQNLFSPSEGFWDIVERFPRIKKKLRLIIAFYNRIDPVFSYNYFKRFNNED